MAVAFAQTQHTFAAKGVEAGTTATVVLQTGWLVTCANVGDSLGFVDHGNEVGQARVREDALEPVDPAACQGEHGWKARPRSCEGRYQACCLSPAECKISAMVSAKA